MAQYVRVGNSFVNLDQVKVCTIWESDEGKHIVFDFDGVQSVYAPQEETEMFLWWLERHSIDVAREYAEAHQEQPAPSDPAIRPDFSSIPDGPLQIL